MSEQSSPYRLLGLTARWTAGARARESLREDRLFDDPWAALLASEEGKEWMEHRSADPGTSVIVRTRFFGDFLQRVAVQHAIRQVVLMAAGLDTRAYRITWSAHTRLFELDQSHVLEYKDFSATCPMNTSRTCRMRLQVWQLLEAGSASTSSIISCLLLPGHNQ
jgi:methyltransferase (TIGR00027 family)